MATFTSIDMGATGGSWGYYTTANTVISAGSVGSTISYTAPEPYAVEEEDERSDNERWLDERIEEVSVEL